MNTAEQKVADLLKPRRKVIAPYPNSPWSVGDILLFKECKYGYYHEHWDGSQKSIWYENYKTNPENSFDTYPHLFRKLEWWEEREEKDMPEYLKVIVDHMEHYGTRHGDIIKVVWCYGADKNFVPFWSQMNKVFWAKYSIPATETEYQQYLLTQK